MGAVTMADVAERAGVSRPTVSYVLSGKDAQLFISEATKLRVLEAVKEMGYRPNGNARAVRSGRFNAVALLLSLDTERSHLPPLLWESIHDQLALSDLHLTMARLPDEQLSDSGVVPKILREWMCDGLLIDLTHRIPQRLIQMIEEHQVPAIWINSKQERDCVRPDDFEAGKRAGEYFLAQGHRSVAYTTYFDTASGDPRLHYSALDRKAGLQAAMEEAGGRAEEFSPSCQMSYASQVAAWSEWLERRDRPRAVAGYSFPMLLPLLRALENSGRGVPGGLELLTFGAHAAHYHELQLPTLIEPTRQVGRESVKMLLRKIEQPETPLPSQTIPFEFSPGSP